MPFQSFDEVRQLDEEALHDLLRTGDAIERLWAAWSLALGLGDAAPGSLDVDAQPHPGVRAHLVVLLASFGRTDALYTLAERDADAGVRAAACQYLIQIAGTEWVDAYRFLGERLLREPEPEPVARILRYLPPSWPTLDRGILIHLAAHGDAAVRAAAIGYLSDHYSGDARAESSLIERLAVEPDPRVLHALSEAVPSGPSGKRILEAAARVPAAALPLVQVLLDHGWRTDWADLAVLARSADPRIRVRCLELCADWSDADGLAWLGATALGGWYHQPPHEVRLDDTELDKGRAYRDVTERARNVIVRLLDDPGFGDWGPLAPALRQMLTEVDEELTWLLREDFELLDAEGIDAQAEVRRLLVSRRRLSTALAPIPGPRTGD